MLYFVFLMYEIIISFIVIVYILGFDSLLEKLLLMRPLKLLKLL